MLSYLIILFELIFIGTTYWYVFMREPKPVDYKSFFPRGRDPWGMYEQQSQRR